MSSRSIAVSEFKQTCLRLIEEVRQTGRSIVITKRGVPIAEVVPISSTERSAWRGAMRGTAKILGDVVSPAADPEDWEALGD
ncbi:MAG: type II toxin-antitoxin system Phd/YefM family antitoxin [Deltaproteobacteria bacterium]|nr:type II toxin-antitoxin system Phd/YefM family antitoxin [Deltaproteobacteria bacterium]